MKEHTRLAGVVAMCAAEPTPAERFAMLAAQYMESPRLAAGFEAVHQLEVQLGESRVELLRELILRMHDTAVLRLTKEEFALVESWFTPWLPKEYTFHNVTITVEADTPKAAYNRLCTLLSDSHVEYSTDTWTDNTHPDDEHPVTDLWPK
jgi:hypothetical protein